MDRRRFLQASGAVCGGLALTRSTSLFANQLGDPWRSFEVTTRVEVLKPEGLTHIWLPAALIRDAPYQRTLSNRFAAQGGTAKLTTNKSSALGIVSSSFPEGTKPALSRIH